MKGKGQESSLQMNFIYPLSLSNITKEVNQTMSVLKSKNKFCPACYCLNGVNG